ncbi:hypothetical protein B0H16DRAFT_933746 [Mycena metata]|uniref:Uncharacterized protein n=1 Tax=Mycena metata TaxID=1033252 RepID=A0AAD7N5X6_9AGAR|nr:hypothetical protein B0H16DRAFT_933746 [Mycena metata]
MASCGNGRVASSSGVCSDNNERTARGLDWRARHNFTTFGLSSSELRACDYQRHRLDLEGNENTEGGWSDTPKGIEAEQQNGTHRLLCLARWHFDLRRGISATARQRLLDSPPAERIHSIPAVHLASSPPRTYALTAATRRCAAVRSHSECSKSITVKRLNAPPSANLMHHHPRSALHPKKRPTHIHHRGTGRLGGLYVENTRAR